MRGFPSIDEACETVIEHLRSLKKSTIAKGPNSIIFNLKVWNDRRGYFKNKWDLLAHLENRVLPICDSFSARRYKFYVNFISDKQDLTEFIAFLLQIPAISRCLNIEIEANGANLPTNLPVYVILNWLNRMPNDGIKFNGREPRHRFLKIAIRTGWIENMHKMMWRYIKQVRFIHFTLFRFYSIFR